MLLFAYDGSLHGDWIAHYAIRFAASLPERQLRLVHVHDGEPAVAPRLERLEQECDRVGVTLQPELVARGGAPVSQVILARAPSDRESFIIAGTRQRPRGFAHLARTVTADLLAEARCGVVAIHAVHPGTLGSPERILLPLAGHQRNAAAVVPLLRCFGAGPLHVHVLFVRELTRFRYRSIEAPSAERLLAEGRHFVRAIEGDLRDAFDPGRLVVDSSVVVSDDAAKEITAHAMKHRSRLICLGASERRLPTRLVHGSPIEQILRDAPCDVAVYRSGR